MNTNPRDKALTDAAPEMYNALRCFINLAEREGLSGKAPVQEARLIISRIELAK
jgi:hypothetical protein